MPAILSAQSNLVPNGSFEQCMNCPTGGGGVIGIQFAPNNVDVNSWENPNIASPDYWSAVNDPTLLVHNIPDGLAFVGIATYPVNQPPQYTNAREYLYCTLLDTLTANRYYWVEFMTRVGAGLSRFASNNLGVHFSDTALNSTNWYYFDVNAQVKFFQNEIIEDTATWTVFSGLYKADGGEKFLNLGNFNTDAETTQGVEFTDGVVWQTYFWLDDVSVTPLDSIPGGIPVDAGPDQTIYIGDSAFIGQKISNMPDMWSELNGTPVASNTAGVYVSPTVNTTYVVTRNLNGFYSTDTVTVFVTGVGLEEDVLNLFTLSPNPSSGDIVLNGEVKGQLSIQIISTDGKRVFEGELSPGSSQSKLKTGLPAGSYMLQLNNRKGKIIFRERMIVTE